MAGKTGKQLDTAELKAVEAQLFSLLRQQSKRKMPMDLPRSVFWQAIAQVLQAIELELATVGRTEGWSVRAQNLSRRQANLRHAVSELTRHRLNAFVGHAALSALSSTPFGDAAPKEANVAAIDWMRHDPAERAFHTGVSELIRKYKHEVSWNHIQSGILSGNITPPPAPAGNAQLDAYVDGPGSLTGQAPPPVAEPTNEAAWEDPDFDEEDLIAAVEGYPELGADEPTFAELEAMEKPAAPAPAPAAKPEPEPAPAAEEAASGLVRIRIITDLPEGIVSPDGEPLELLEGDVQQLNPLVADTLIAAGLAEAAPL